jgi:hypothetical protein
LVRNLPFTIEIKGFNLDEQERKDRFDNFNTTSGNKIRNALTGYNYDEP